MDRNFRKDAAQRAGDSPPSEAWLFAQAILGNPIPDPTARLKTAQAQREYFQWLSEIFPEAQPLRELRTAQE